MGSQKQFETFFSCSQVEKLLAAYEDMMVELSEAAELKARQEQAQTWVTEAQEHLSIAEKPIEEHSPILEVSSIPFA